MNREMSKFIMNAHNDDWRLQRIPGIYAVYSDHCILIATY